MTPAPDNQVAALREEIQCAGERARRHWFWFTRVGLFVGGPTLGIGFVSVLLGVPFGYTVTIFDWAAGLAGVTLLACVLVFPFWIAADTARTLLCRRSLRKKVRQLPRAAQAEVLLPLTSHDCVETRAIVHSLIGAVRLTAGEVSPASGPAGRGDEASPAG
jgi:hypothetical protein